MCVAAAQQFVFKQRKFIKYNIFAVANFAVDRLKLPAPPTGFRGKQRMFGNSLSLLAPDLAAGLGFADLGRFILSLDELGPKLIGA